MKTMTKKEFTRFAFAHGVEARYSGKDRRFHLNRIMSLWFVYPKMDIHVIINSKTP